MGGGGGASFTNIPGKVPTLLTSTVGVVDIDVQSPNDVIQKTQRIPVVVQFYPWFKFYFPLFQTHYHILPRPKTKENKI